MTPAERIERMQGELAQASADRGIELDDVQRELLRAATALTRALAVLRREAKPTPTNEVRHD